MQHTPIVDPALYPAGSPIEPGGSAVAWSAVWAGTVTAIASSLILGALASGIGFSASSAWPGLGVKPSTFTIGAGISLLVIQWVSAALGGYMAGRMRTRWHGLHTDEVFFRDTAHGLVTWAMATIIVVGVAVLGSALMAPGAPAPGDIELTAAAAEAARKSAEAFSFFTALSMVIGAFVACVAAAIGGGLRDKHP